MAAALADRHAIAVRLLQSAGHEAWMLTHAINKYGQTAAHLAARKGSHMLLMALLNAGGRSIATVSHCSKPFLSKRNSSQFYLLLKIGC